MKEHSNSGTESPALTIDNFLATRMDDRGVREYTLASPHLVQLPSNQGTWLEKPEIDVFQDNGQARDWLIRAKAGWISADNRLIRLEQGVSMKRPATSGKRPVSITTPSLRVYPYEEYTETAEPVRMETSGGVVNAVGLKARLRTEQLELLSDVRGIYVPPKP